jgi:hypothetical protein
MPQVKPLLVQEKYQKPRTGRAGSHAVAGAWEFRNIRAGTAEYPRYIGSVLVLGPTRGAAGSKAPEKRVGHFW